MAQTRVHGTGDHHDIAADSADPEGVFQRYRRPIAMRREMAVVRHGGFRPIAPDHPAVLAYKHELGAERLLVIANFTGEPATLDLDAGDAVSGTDAIVGGSRSAVGRVALRPYETIVIAGR